MISFKSKKFLVIIFVCLFTYLSITATVTAVATDKIPVIIIFDSIDPDAGIARLTEKIGPFHVKYKYPSLPGIAANLTEGQIKALDKIPFVERFEYDGDFVHIMLDSATLWFGVDKAVNDFGVNGNLDGDTAYSPDDVVVAIIDTGIDVNHVDLDDVPYGSKVIGWKDFVNDKPEPYDDHGHGTHVSSIATGTGEGDSAYTGVAPGAALVGVKVLSSRGSGTISDVNAGIQWVINNKETLGIEILSMSIGISGSSDGTDSTSTLVNQAVEAGIVTVVAAGNDGPKTYTIGSPAAAENAITVGAMADVGELGFYQASFSSRGPTADDRIKPDISAPGVYVTAAKAGSTNDYVTYSGTSMSTPFVAGTVALMLHANSSLNTAEVKSLIMNTAIDWGPSGKDIDYGSGRLDSYDAVKAAEGSTTGSGPSVPEHVYEEDSLTGTGESDYWQYNVTTTSYPIAITLIMPDWRVVTPVRTDPDFDLYLYDPDGVRIASSLGVKRQETIGVSITKTGNYMVRVYSYSGSGNYFFDISAGLAAPDNPPSVSIIDPSDGELVSGVVTIEASASDDYGVSKVEFYVDGTLLGTVATSPYVLDWNTTTVADGSHTVEAVATDTVGQTGSHQIGVTVDNTGPETSSVAANPNPTEGATSVTLTATVDDSASVNSNIVAAEYFVDTVGADGTGTPMSPSDGAFDSPTENVTASIDVSGWAVGNYTIYVHGTDSAGNWGATSSVVLQVTELNQPPVADADGPYTGTEGVAITFNGSGSYDSDGVIASYIWDFGDGTTGSGVSPTHTYVQNGTYTVTLTVTDDDSATGTDTTTATVADTNPTADFSATPTSGAEPLTVSFTDISTSYDGVVAWEWDFESDGVVDSTEQSPTYTYAQQGTYTVTLKVTEADGDTDTVTKLEYITVSDSVPTASFTYSPASPLEGDFVTFDASGSTGYDQPLSYSWDFGDGNTGTGVTTTHTYASEGLYTVTLTVVDGDESIDSTSQTITVADKDPLADFSGTPTSGTEPLTVDFTDASLSYDGVVAWEWDFESDGVIDSTVQNPTHTYDQDGNYTVTLKVYEDDGDSVTETKVDYITVTDTGPTADFTASPLSGSEPLTVNFSDLSTSYDGIVGWSWDFGDGQTSTEQSPTHTYANEGIYTISLTVYEADGDSSIETKIDYVTVADTEPTADFTASPLSGPEPLSVSFTDASTSYDGVVSWSWDFGDGTTGTGASPSHTYTSDGTYTVSLTIFEADGDSDTKTKIDYITVTDAEPTAEFTADPTSGPAPLTVSFTDLSTSHDGITAWEWDFDNDGVVDSMEQNPTHVYDQEGVYTVTLRVYEGDGDSATETKTDYIAVGAALEVHDVSIKQLRAPKKVKTGVTKDIVVKVYNKGTQTETVTVTLDIYVDGVWSGSQNVTLAVEPGGGGTTFTFTYTFTEDPGTTVTFKAEATIEGFADEYPDDNIATASTSVT